MGGEEYAFHSKNIPLEQAYEIGRILIELQE